VTGQYVAKAHMGRWQRARLAADLTHGTAAVFPLTVKQAAAVARVPVFDVTAARRNGKRSNGNGHHDAESLAAHLGRATPDELVAAARMLGINRVWDEMISPILSEERASQEA
jgi:hypothetical protein